MFNLRVNKDVLPEAAVDALRSFLNYNDGHYVVKAAIHVHLTDKGETKLAFLYENVKGHLIKVGVHYLDVKYT